MGNTTITVHYGRKQTDKLGDGSFDSIELGGDLALEVDDNEDPFALYNAAYAKLAEAIEEKLVEYQPRVIQRPEFVSKSAPVPQESEQEAKPQASGRGWVDQEIRKNTAAIHERIGALPGEKIQEKQPGAVNTIDEYGTPSTEIIVPNEAVAFQRCRVFEVKADKASNGNPYVSIRIGKRGEDGIPGQYTTARSFDNSVIKSVAFFDAEERTWNYKIRDGDFVDVWGYFKPWKQNPEKFDLELQKIQLHEE